MPVRASTVSMNRRSEDVTSALGRPATATEASSSRAPGCTTTPWSRTRTVISDISHSPTTSGDAGRFALASR